MVPKPRHTMRFWVFALVMMTIMQPLALRFTGVFLCIGGDGHVGIEDSSLACCADGRCSPGAAEVLRSTGSGSWSAGPSGTGIASASCVSCVDIPLLSASVKQAPSLKRWAQAALSPVTPELPSAAAPSHAVRPAQTTLLVLHPGSIPLRC